MESIFGRGGKVFLGEEATRAGLRSESISTGAMLCRQEQSFVDRSHVVSTETILQAVPAVLCRQEQLEDIANMESMFGFGLGESFPRRECCKNRSEVKINVYRSKTL